MELIRKIMLKIENDYKGISLRDPKIEDYSNVIVAEHCHLLYDHGFINEYKPIKADGTPVLTFWVGNLTWDGYDFLEKIRQDSVWNKTKEVITTQGLPMVIDVVKQVAQSIITSMTEGAINAMLHQ